MRLEVVGVIGSKGMKPTCTWQTKERQGKGRISVPFMRFSMWCENLTKRPEMNATTGRMERPKEIVQVILREDAQKLFNTLSPGRTVMVSGRMNVNPRVEMKDGQQHVYSNIQVYCDELKFMDSPIERQMARAIGLLVAAGAITETDGQTFTAKGNAYLAAQAEQNGPPRVEENRPPDSPTTNSATEHANLDPDHPDF